MKLIPAIDLMDGKCVRLHKGDFEKVTFYDITPLDLVKEYEAMGFDNIHIVDLANAHVSALNYVMSNNYNLDIINFNLGTGVGVTVLEVINCFEHALNQKIMIDFVTRRPGDIDECYTSPKLANNHLGWKSDKTIMDMCKDYVSWSRKMNIIDI